MAQVVDSNEPVIIQESDHEHVREPVERRSNTPVILGVILLIIVLALLLFRYNPVGGGSGGTTNVTVPTPSTSTGR